MSECDHAVVEAILHRGARCHKCGAFAFFDQATQPRGAADLKELLAVLPDALSAMTEASDYARAPEPSDEPGSDYVVGLAHMIVAGLNRLAATKQDSTDTLLDRLKKVAHWSQLLIDHPDLVTTVGEAGHDWLGGLRHALAELDTERESE